MRRKLVKQGASALTVTLPYRWVRQRNLAPGEDVILEERGAELVIRGHGEPEPRRVSVDVSALNERTVRWLLSGLHKGGYDEIEVLHASKATLALIQELVKDLLLGFAIMEQTDRRCVLRMLAKDSSEEFEATLRRAFFVTVSMAESLLDILRQRKHAELKDLAVLERTNNQLTNFCERILNKNLYEGNKGTHFLYVVAWNLEKIADDYRRICERLSSLKAVDEETVAMVAETNAQFKAYHELFYSFDANALAELSARRDSLLRRIWQDLEAGKGDPVALSCLAAIVLRCEDFSTSTFMLARGG
jgi:phosphate uptake regulator